MGMLLTCRLIIGNVIQQILLLFLKELFKKKLRDVYEATLFCFVFLIFIYLAVPILSCGIQTLSCGMWDLLSRPGIKPGPLAMGAPSLSHWTTREVLIFILLCLIYLSQHYAFKSGLYCTMYQDFLSFLRLNSISLYV